MAVDKLVDSTQLDSDLTSIANAIRTKGGTSAQLAFPSGFVSAINAISGGGGVDPGEFKILSGDIVPASSSKTLTIPRTGVTTVFFCAGFMDLDEQDDCRYDSTYDNKIYGWLFCGAEQKDFFDSNYTGAATPLFFFLSTNANGHSYVTSGGSAMSSGNIRIGKSTNSYAFLKDATYHYIVVGV